MRSQEPGRAAGEPGGGVDFPPVENGLDYLLSVVEHLARPPQDMTPRHLKYAVLHLQAATEVLLKSVSSASTGRWSSRTWMWPGQARTRR
ncbi:hypothetical protein [Streptomyces sp. NPDC058371]|uniref:hypothetical protein n=1 Tax=Streptomyces sp. NPDC058371 TaxID=3346463 RepID=UPI0036485C5A